MAKKYSKIIDFDINRHAKNDTEEEHIYLYRLVINKEERRKGLGTQFMKDLCTYADLENIHLRLTPIPLDDEINKDRLKRFYRNFGFKKMRDCETMKRPPKKPILISLKAEIK